MNRGIKKGLSQSIDKHFFVWLEQVSKNALADALIDVVRADIGDDEIDGAVLVEALNAKMGPTRRIRKDATPKPWDGKCAACQGTGCVDSWSQSTGRGTVTCHFCGGTGQ